ncbi:transposon Ty3-G Gag-Pol polyprotein [Nephila pilipes]|uniref:Transposon Ty3-G Gag-Pol polyprotein n=1 Tax=Nephila pilipes TaxID=299642 RepID=A0A8X6TMC9_NEPPI|nr:transposon Ty3-G Gag-Pol polyprotein [Nephila pilipes]
MRKSTPSYHHKKIYPVKEPSQDRKSHFEIGDKVEKEEPSEVVCYQWTINGVMGIVCADTAATYSIAGETLYHILKKQGTTFSTGSLTVSLADGSKIEREVNTTCVKIRLGSRTLPLNLVAIPGAKNNSTLLGMDFLESSDQPKRQFHFVEQVQESCDAVKSNVSQTAAPLTVKETDHPDLSHADEVNHLTSIQQLELKDHPDQLR